MWVIRWRGMPEKRCHQHKMGLIPSCLPYLLGVLAQMWARVAAPPTSTPPCRHTIGVYSIGDATLLQDAVSVGGICFRGFNQSTPFFQAVGAGELDLALCSPTLNACIMSEYMFTPVAGMIGRDGSTTIAGDILVSSSSTFTTIQSLQGSRLVCGPFYITANFQLQAATIASGDLFSMFRFVAVESNATVMLLALARGDFDVAFFRSDQQSSFPGDFRTSFRIIGEGRNMASTAPYAQWQVTASPNMTEVDRMAVFDAYTNLSKSDPATIKANITGFGLPYDYVAYAILLEQLGLVDDHGHCTVVSDQDLYSYVTCPQGSRKVGASDNKSRCSMYQQCSTRFCICSPCYRPLTTVVVGMKPAVFWPTVVVIVLAFWLLCWLLQSLQTGAGMVPCVPEEAVRLLPSAGEVCITPDGPVVLARMDEDIVTLVPILRQRTSLWSQRTVWQRVADACRLDHPNIVKAKGVVRTGGVLYVVCEHFSGTLAQRLEVTDLEPGEQDPKEVVRIAKDVTCGLHRLHAEAPGLTHRLSTHTTVMDPQRRVMLLLCSFRHPRTRNCQEDVFHLGQLLCRLFERTSLDDPVLQECTAPITRLRPSAMQVLSRMMHLEQCVLDSQSKLLDSIMPAFASTALSMGNAVQPRSHSSVAVLFCDVMGFTSICSKIPAGAVVDMLTRLYLAFDGLAIKWAIHKQEIVGDCWVGTTNVLHDQTTDYAARLVIFALEMRLAANRTAVEVDGCERQIDVRIGIHVGPVHSGVVGMTLNPKFCVIGDTINVAQRMESTSGKNQIHLSGQAAAVVSDQSPGLAHYIVPREELLEVKGKGRMQTYFLT